MAVNEKEIRQLQHGKAVGTSAQDILSDEKYTALKIEVQYMPGYAPDDEALENLRIFLYNHINKPDGITIATKEIKASKDTSLTLQEIGVIENKNRTAFTHAKELAIYILYTNGFFSEDKMLGYAYLNTSAVLFGKNIHENSNSFRKPNRTQLETRILQHELGHLMGLVNTGFVSKSQHTDEVHGKHCTNKKCLMYYLTDTEESPSLIIKKQIPVLDAYCLNDLKANGGH